MQAAFSTASRPIEPYRSGNRRVADAIYLSVSCTREEHFKQEALHSFTLKGRTTDHHLYDSLPFPLSNLWQILTSFTTDYDWDLPSTH